MPSDRWLNHSRRFLHFHPTCLSSETHREKQTWRTASLGPAADLHPIVVLRITTTAAVTTTTTVKSRASRSRCVAPMTTQVLNSRHSDSVIFRGRAYTPDKSPGVLR